MAAYRAGEKLQDLKTGETIDYSRKQGVLYSEIITPEHAPEWARNRQELWNRSEAAHRRGDAIVAREIHLSLPHELNDPQRQELTTGFARFFAEKYNVAVDMNLHAPNKEGDDRNYHAHLLICTRPFDASKAQGLGNNVRVFDAITHQKAGTENHVELWRATWERQMNEALERAEVRDAEGVTIKVDHRSYERQGVEQEPTIKEGTAATALKRRGEETERSQINEDIRQRNEERAQLAAEIKAAAQELDVLRRRQAEQMTAEQIGANLTASNDNVRHDNASHDNAPPEPLPRAAENLTAEQVQQAMTPSNDNEPEDDFGLTRMDWETEERFRARVTRAVEYAREREQEQEQQKERQKPDAPARYRQMDWETNQEFRERVERAEREQAERKEQPPRARLTLEYTP